VLKALLKPFGIRRFFTDGWGAYRRHLAEPANALPNNWSANI
jgi:IS1 family transposase